MAALVAIQKPELVEGVVFSAPAILPGTGVVLVRTMACIMIAGVSHVFCSVD